MDKVLIEFPLKVAGDGASGPVDLAISGVDQGGGNY
jgi:hypothetical protein